MDSRYRAFMRSRRYSIEWWDDPDGPSGEVEVGPGGATYMAPCTRLTSEADDDHSVELVVSIDDGRPVVESVTVRRNPAAGHLRPADLRRVPLTELLEEAVRVSVLGPRVPGRDDAFEVAGDDVVSAVVKASRRRRTEVTPARLREVADAVGRLRGDMELVGDAIGTSTSQAYRLVQRAKKDIDPRTGVPYLDEDQ